MTDQDKKRPEYRNINLFTDVRTYRLPPAGFVSILHRVSGLLMFLLLPFFIWLFDKSVSTYASYDSLTSVFQGSLGWLVKLVCLGLIWAYLHHFCAGLRHLFMDVNHHAVTKEFGKSSAITVLVISLLLTVALGAKLFGLY